jgi:hypothetical protein
MEEEGLERRLGTAVTFADNGRREVLGVAIGVQRRLS